MLGHDSINKREVSVPDTAANPTSAKQRGSKELLSQLQRLQALQLEAQSLVV